MDTPQTLIAIAAASFLAACSSPSGITAQQYTALDRAPAASESQELSLRLRIKEPMSSPRTLAERDITVGKSFQVAAQRDFIYPASYEPAIQSANRSAVTPATPTRFQTVKTGFQADLRSSRHGSAIVLEGSVTVTEFQGFSRMGGVHGQPILDGVGRLVTANRIEMPKLATFTTPVYVAVQPGKSGSFEISHPRKRATLTIELD